jgi:hypothetical protein
VAGHEQQLARPRSPAVLVRRFSLPGARARFALRGFAEVPVDDRAGDSEAVTPSRRCRPPANGGLLGAAV